jgi:predicted TIM-barrel fold metal-dependent hydrolase
MSSSITSRQVRETIGHPVIDADGHYQEFSTLIRDDVLEAAKDVGGMPLVAKVEATALTFDDDRGGWQAMDEGQRRDTWAPCMAWWAMPTNALDRATAHLPELLHERMDELGIDVSVLYPSVGLGLASTPDEEVRRLGVRVFNKRTAEHFAPYRDRMTPVAVLPMFSPEEAVDELEQSVADGAKMVMLGTVRRPVPKVAREHPDAARFTVHNELFAIDSEHDYDVLWRRCDELGIPIGVHHSEQGYASFRSPSRYVYNHMGGFSAGSNAICKAIFLGGVTYRFPRLRFAFLEGGVGWAVSLLGDIISHWEKRNAGSIGSLDPDSIDFTEVERLIGQYGTDAVKGRMDLVRTYFGRQGWRPEQTDDWRSCGIEALDDIAERFLTPFFFGCEADDATNALAFDGRLNPWGRSLGCVFGSDFGHWDVPSMSGVVAEAYEMVEDGLVTPEQFREFMFANPLRLLAGPNPRFFEGTVCEAAVAAELAKAPVGAVAG